jgi:DNA helicase II / ATP-dependent DNA helicase PcrA
VTSRAGKPDTPADIELRKVLDDDPRGAFSMVAGAGSGKTTSLVKALAHVVENHGDELRARTQQVACITYTEIAAREIHDDVGNNNLVHVSTIHSFLWTVIQPFRRDIKAWIKARLEEKLRERESEQRNFGSRVQAKRRGTVAADIERYYRQLDTIDDVGSYTYGIASEYSKGVIGHSDILRMVPELIMKSILLARIVGNRFPFIFVDESQDTFPEIVQCLKHVQRTAQGRVCLGFFGDPMQHIYPQGVGRINIEDGWQEIQKPENFRSSLPVLAVVNRVRAAADGLLQVSGLPSGTCPQGQVDFFVLPADDSRTENLARVRTWLDRHNRASGNGSWTADAPDDGAKILMIVHEMAAKRLGFCALRAAFRTGSGRLSEAFEDGSAWPLTPFSNVIMPLCRTTGDNDPSIIPILRKLSPALADDAIKNSTVRAALVSARESVAQIRETVTSGGKGSIGQVLRIADGAGIIDTDPRLSAYLNPTGPHADVVISEDERSLLDAFVECDTHELPGYFKYVNEESPYSTQHGTKGSEFARVIVVLDDDEGKFNLYSYEKLLGIRELSNKDKENERIGTDSVLGRTRRLLYVCVSRAVESLAVVLYAYDVKAAVSALMQSGLPGDAELHTVNDLWPERENAHAGLPRCPPPAAPTAVPSATTGGRADQ